MTKQNEQSFNHNFFPFKSFQFSSLSFSYALSIANTAHSALPMANWFRFEFTLCQYSYMCSCWFSDVQEKLLITVETDHISYASRGWIESLHKWIHSISTLNFILSQNVDNFSHQTEIQSKILWSFLELHCYAKYQSYFCLIYISGVKKLPVFITNATREVHIFNTFVLCSNIAIAANNRNIIIKKFNQLSQYCNLWVFLWQTTNTSSNSLVRLNSFSIHLSDHHIITKLFQLCIRV